MECKGQVYFHVIIIIHHGCCISHLCKTLPLQCSSLLHEDLSTAGCHLSSGREWLCCGVWSRLKHGKCSRNSRVSAMDLLVSSTQLAPIPSLPAMLLGWTRLCNRRGKHSTSVVPAPRVATGLFLMILIKPGPFPSISQRGKRLDRLHGLLCNFILHPHLAQGGNTGCFFSCWCICESCTSLLRVSIVTLPALLIPRHWHAWCHPWSGMDTDCVSSRGNKESIAQMYSGEFSLSNLKTALRPSFDEKWCCQSLIEFSFPDFSHCF